MKYWIIPTITEFVGIGFAVLLLIFLFSVMSSERWNDFNKNEKLFFLFGITANALVFLFGFQQIATSDRLKQHKRILQKAGLWTDERIKGKDLPKQEDQ